jgi:predicted acylesterase/phospholipase RssA/ankyrin repeat protein
VLLAIALAVATLTNKEVEAEETALSWEELELIAQLFGVELPENRDPETLKKTGYKCFYAVLQACLKGDWDLVDRVLPATLSKLTDAWGQSLLIAAAGEGNKAAVEGLINHKIALEERDHEGNTPLHVAAKNGFHNLVAPLWSRYIEKTNHEGKTPHHIAVEYGHLALLKALIAKKPTTAPLQQGNLSLSLLALCIKHSQKECLDYLLTQASYQLEEKSSTHGTLVHIAIHFRQSSILKTLVERKNTLLNEYDAEGRSPLDLAAFLGDLDALDFLYPKIGDKGGHDGWTAVHWAVKGKQSEALEHLASLGANLEAKNGQGKKPKALLKGDTSVEADQIRTILRSGVENRDKTRLSSLDFRTQPPEGIVFKGGGPRGLAYLGALRALKDKNVLGEVQRTAGTSAGAITAAIFALDPKLKDIDSLEDLNLMDFLDPAPGKEALLKAMLASKDKEDTLSKICSGSLEIAKETWNPIKLYNMFSQLDGICEGETLRRWIETEIHKRTGIENCTFGELREEIKRGRGYLHLHVYTTRLEADPKDRILHLSSENPEWDSIVIADAIRASMSIPGVYKPYTLREKTRSKTLIARTDLGPCVDGGLVKNFPIDAFDNPKPGDHYSSFNRRTLGLCLKDVEDAKIAPTPVTEIMDIIKACASTYWTVEETYLSEKKENQDRIIEIPIHGVGLLDFNLRPEQKAGLLSSGKQSIESPNSLFSEEKADAAFRIHLRASNIPEKLPDFTGRQEQLRALEKALVSESVPSPNQTIVRLIYGLGGMGKTELTRAFACDHQKDFSIIWFISSATTEQKNQSYRELAQELKLDIDKNAPYEIERKVHNRLKEHPYEKPWLLIYDNIEEAFTPPQGGYVLITSRKREVWGNDKERIEVAEFGLEESLKVLSEITRKNSPRMSELARELGYFPLALNQAAHYIRRVDCSIEDYLAAVRKNPITGRMEKSERYEHTVGTVWKITLEKLEKEHSKAYAWLKVCAYLNPDDIPQEWLDAWIEKQENTDPWDKIEITKVLSDLLLIRSRGRQHSMHRLLQQVVKQHDADEVFREAFQLVESKWVQTKKLDLESSSERDLGWLAQAKCIETSPFFQTISWENRVIFLMYLGEWENYLYNYEKALEYDLKALNSFKEYPGCEELTLAKAYDNVGMDFWDLRKNTEALEHVRNGLNIREKYPPSLDLAKSYHHMGKCLEGEVALEYEKKALNIRKDKLPPNDIELVDSYIGVGMCLQEIGDFSQALIYQQQVLEMIERDHPSNSRYLAGCHLNMAKLLKLLHRDDQALEHIQKTLGILSFFEKHPYHGPSLDLFLEILKNQTDRTLAEKAKQDILALYTPKLGEDHPLIKELKAAGPKKGWWPFS